MKPITAEQKLRAIEVLSKAFKNVPGVLWILKKDGQLATRLRILCAFCIEAAIKKGGAFITSDQKGVALIFKNTRRQNIFHWIKEFVFLANRSIGWSRVWSMIQRERLIRSKRMKQEHLYFWMMGVEDNSNGLQTVIEIRDHMVNMSKEYNLPIVSETTVPRNLKTYQRYGFRIYDECYVPSEDLTIWFLVRDKDVVQEMLRKAS
jgi:hypothetical protein